MEKIKKLELQGITRAFGTARAVVDFNLEITGGTFVSLLGPSGCGKSTALNCIAGLLDLTAGAIVLNGQPIHHIPAEKRGIGMVFQNYALFPHLNVIRNVSYGLENHSMPRMEIERRVRWALDLVHLDIEEFGNRFPAQLSGGQQQRLAIARTIALEPALLLLDEPLSNLDTKLRNEMRIEIKNMHRQLGLTTIYVTHDQSEAMSLSDVVVVMRAGRIEQVGTPQAIYDCPNSLYVADFMGYSNRLPVKIMGHEGSEWHVQTDTGVALRATSTFSGSASWEPGERVVAVSRSDELLAEPLPDTNQMRGMVHLVDFVGKAYEIPTVALRFFNVYGPRQSLSNPYTGVAAIFSSRLLNNKPPIVFEDGLQSRDFVHVKDIVQGLLLALKCDEANYEAINLGTGRCLPILEMAQALIGKLNVPVQPQILGQYRKGDIRHCYADIRKAQRLLGFRPTVAFEDGVGDLVEWIGQQTATDQVETAISELATRGLTN